MKVDIASSGYVGLSSSILLAQYDQLVHLDIVTLTGAVLGPIWSAL